MNAVDDTQKTALHHAVKSSKERHSSPRAQLPGRWGTGRDLAPATACWRYDRCTRPQRMHGLSPSTKSVKMKKIRSPSLNMLHAHMPWFRL